MARALCFTEAETRTNIVADAMVPINIVHADQGGGVATRNAQELARNFPRTSQRQPTATAAVYEAKEETLFVGRIEAAFTSERGITFFSNYFLLPS